MQLDIRDTTGRLVYRFKESLAVHYSGMLIPASRQRNVKTPEDGSKYYELEDNFKIDVAGTGAFEAFFVKGYKLEVIK